MTTPNARADLTVVPDPDGEVLPAVRAQGAMAGWTESMEETRRVVHTYRPDQPPIVSPPSDRTGATPALATAVANLELAVRGVCYLLVALLVLAMIVGVVRALLWLA